MKRGGGRKRKKRDQEVKRGGKRWGENIREGRGKIRWSVTRRGSLEYGRQEGREKSLCNHCTTIFFAKLFYPKTNVLTHKN